MTRRMMSACLAVLLLSGVAACDDEDSASEEIGDAIEDTGDNIEDSAEEAADEMDQ